MRQPDTSSNFSLSTFPSTRHYHSTQQRHWFVKNAVDGLHQRNVYQILIGFVFPSLLTIAICLAWSGPTPTRVTSNIIFSVASRVSWPRVKALWLYRKVVMQQSDLHGYIRLYLKAIMFYKFIQMFSHLTCIIVYGVIPTCSFSGKHNNRSQ